MAIKPRHTWSRILSRRLQSWISSTKQRKSILPMRSPRRRRRITGGESERGMKFDLCNLYLWSNKYPALFGQQHCRLMHVTSFRVTLFDSDSFHFVVFVQLLCKSSNYTCLCAVSWQKGRFVHSVHDVTT